MTLTPAELDALECVARSQRRHAMPDEKVLLGLEARGLAVWNGMWGGSPPGRWRVYVLTPEGAKVLKAMKGDGT